MAKYLDSNGVLYLWNKIGGFFATKAEVPNDVGDLSNSAGYQTSQQVQQAINSALSGISGIEFSIVEQLPATGVAGTIYLVSKAVTATGNIYTEWIYVNNKWETLGDTTVDLSDYLKKTDVSALTNEEIDDVTQVGGV